MATINVGASNFGEVITREGITLIDFWAEWCGPCRQFGPIFENASENHPDITFAKVDTEAEQALANDANITSIPTLMVFRDGVLLYNRPGALPSTALSELITAVRELDMNEVRADIAAQASKLEDEGNI